jgi:hypothetical protein
MTIDDTLRTAITRDKIVGLTLWPTLDNRWQAAVTFDRVSWRISINADPVKAVRAALGDRAEPAMGMFE